MSHILLPRRFIILMPLHFYWFLFIIRRVEIICFISHLISLLIVYFVAFDSLRRRWNSHHADVFLLYYYLPTEFPLSWLNIYTVFISYFLYRLLDKPDAYDFDFRHDTPSGLLSAFNTPPIQQFMTSWGTTILAFTRRSRRNCNISITRSIDVYVFPIVMNFMTSFIKLIAWYRRELVSRYYRLC